VAEVTCSANLVGEECLFPRGTPTEEHPARPIWVAEVPEYQGGELRAVNRHAPSTSKWQRLPGWMLGFGFWVRWAGSCLLAFEPGAFPVLASRPARSANLGRPG